MGIYKLYNTAKKLREDHSFTVGYFGGSITEGAGASDTEKTSWRALTTQWLREEYPECDIKEINAAIGGTGSDLGAYRCNKDLLVHKPDLVFIEFAVNDNIRDSERSLRSMEGIVRQIWNKNMETDIIFVYTLEKSMAEIYANGGIPLPVENHQRIADHYGIPTINVGKMIWKVMHNGEGTWEDLMPDGVHPSDAGHKIYADAVTAFMANMLNCPAPITQRPLQIAYMVEAWEVAGDNWIKDENTLARRYPHMLTCNTVGSELEFRFNGSAVGLYWLVAPDSGDIEWSIDGSEVQRASSWDKYALRFTRAHYCILNDNLTKGEHVLRIKVIDEKQPESTGNWIRIGAFLVAE